jgi:hypothetical protein
MRLVTDPRQRRFSRLDRITHVKCPYNMCAAEFTPTEKLLTPDV